MAITITTPPQFVQFSGNPIPLKVRTDNQYSSAGEYASVSLRFGGTYPDAAETFRYINDLFDLTFSFVNDATASPNSQQILRNDTAAYSEFIDWLEQAVLPVILKHKLIRDNYAVSVGYDDAEGEYFLTLTAFATGASYDLTHSDTMSNGTATVLQTGSETVIRDNFKVCVDLYTQTMNQIGPAGFAFKGTLEGSPDTEGYVTFDLSQVLVIPSVNSPDALNYSNANENVGLQYVYMVYEKYGAPVVSYTSINSSLSTPKLVLKGALEDDIWPLEALYEDKLDITENQFLNSMPRILSCCRSQPQWLYFFIQDTVDFKVKATYYLEDSSSTTIVLADITNIGINRIACIKAGVEQNAGLDISDIVKYEIWCEFNSGGKKSEKITFLISEVDFEFNRFLLFRNKYGTFETVWCHGSANTSHEFTSQQASMRQDPGIRSVSRLNKVFNKSYETTVELSTGIKGREDSFDGKAYKNYLVDLLNSDEVYEITGSTFLPVKLITKNEPGVDDQQTIYDQPIKYVYAFNNKLAQ